MKKMQLLLHYGYKRKKDEENEEVVTKIKILKRNNKITKMKTEGKSYKKYYKKQGWIVKIKKNKKVEKKD